MNTAFVNSVEYEILNDITSFVKNRQVCPYKGTFLEGITDMVPLHRGIIGQELAGSMIRRALNIDVKVLNGTGDDIWVGPLREPCEVKASFGKKSRGAITGQVNHVQMNKKFSKIVILGVCCDIRGEISHRIVWFSKDDIRALIADGTLRRQGGGNKSTNDDYSCATIKMINHPLAKELSEWC